MDTLLDLHGSHKSGRTTQHGHTQTKLRGKPTDIERQASPVLFDSRNFMVITFHSLPTPTSFLGRLCAVLSHTLYTIQSFCLLSWF
jgi:hypothetical protein